MIKLYKKLILSKVYKKWRNKSRNSFLSSFVIIDSIPQFDFYNKNSTITSFIMGKKIEIKENQEIFNKTELNPLEVKDIKLSKNKVMNIISSRYPDEKFTKTIMILQNQGKLSWNITMVSSSLKLLNIKIDMNKNIISEAFEPLASFMKQIK